MGTPVCRIYLICIFSISFVLGCSSQTELEWQEGDGYRWAELNPGFWGSTGFKQLPSSKTNILFRNDVRQELKEENRNYLNGSGVAVADINGNGLADIYFARLDGPNKLYRNLGNYRFEDITEQAGVAHEGYSSTGVVFADVNGNGFPDLLISSLSEGNSLYINDGQGNFELKTDSGLGESRGAKSMALADINGNGHLDLYITNYNIRSVRDLYGPDELTSEHTIEIVDGEMKIREPFEQYYVIVETDGESFLSEKGTADELYLNRGDGVFERADASRHFFDERGDSTELPLDWGLTATFRDVTGNGLPDLYVANDFWTPDRFWINRGDGTFKAIDTHAIRSVSYSAMGVDFSDINRNGHLDFVVTEMLSQKHVMRMRQVSQFMIGLEGRALYNRNSVYLNRGDTTFAQIANYSGLEASEWSWATYFMDVNLDGYEDLIVATGFSNDYQDMDTQVALYEYDAGLSQGTGDVMNYPLLELENRIFRNNGDLTFTDVSREWGFDVEDISHGMALADLNNDGDLDLIINRLDEEAAIYENRTNAPRIAVRLKGESPNTQGIGAKIKLDGGPVMQSKEMTAGGNYLSGSQAQVVFAAEKGSSGHTITVTWPGGRESVIENVQANRIYEIDQSGAVAPARSERPESRTSTPLFEDISDRISHKHHENEYDDFRFSPLLPLKLSRLGPGAAWLDFNRNGDNDLLITSGKDGYLALYENRGDGNFEPAKLDPLTGEAPGDQTSIIGWVENGLTRIAVGSANYEQGNPNVPSAYVYSIGGDGNIGLQDIPGILSTTGPVAAADYSGSGYLDLFIGGRHQPGQYPTDADSRVFRNVDGNFVLDERNSRVLSGAGLVTDAVFADFTGNSRQDLLISTEWGTLKLFENRNGQFREITDETGLAGYKGWWKGVATGDFTNNGLTDIVALNIGLNSSYQIRDGRPLRIYYDDFNWDGRLNILETWYSDEVGAYVPRRKLHDFESIPTILRNVSSHREFAVSSIETIFDQEFDGVPYKEINTLEHMVFINTGDGFVGQPLPAKAQFSSAFSAVVADFDNDGNEDLFISQNFFAFPDNTPRLDAGRGLILKGDGRGNFTPMSGSDSGIKVYGEQRGAALSDINRNGKVDLVVTQNNDQTKLFMNRADKPGIRVSLEGPESNQLAIGSSLRLVYSDGSKGPRRSVQAGSGYGSQNSTTQVMGMAGDPVQIEVTWFDGTTAVTDIEENVMECRIFY
jgi:enediyne biosynthesis protein E4